MADEIIEGPGFAVGSLDSLGEGVGIRKVRVPLGVTAFGVNAIVLPPGYTTNYHYHDVQQELYICIDGPLFIEFEEGGKHELVAGSMARVDAATVRRVGNPGDQPATYVCVGGADGYVGRDGRSPGDQPS